MSEKRTKEVQKELTDLERKYLDIATWQPVTLDQMRDYRVVPFEQREYVETYVTYGAYEKRI